jgi:phasin
MSQSKFDEHARIRDFADKSIEQSRNAFEAFWKASRAAMVPVEAALPEPAREARAKALSYSEANLRTAFDHAQKLARAKDPQEFWKLQSDFTRAQFEAFQEQVKEFTSAIQTANPSKPNDAP